MRWFHSKNETAGSFVPGSSPVLSCEGLHRYLGSGAGRVHVLRGVDFQAEEGQIHAVVGPSGCGKSTLLYLLGLLDRADEGTIWLGGENVSTIGEEARTRARNEKIGFVFQFHFLLAEFTALENVMIPMRRRNRLSPAQMKSRALQLLSDVGLAEKEGRLANELSGGEQQRVAVARALANEPLVLLADEPTGNLDQKNSVLVFDLLRRLAAEKKMAAILVTHNRELAGRSDVVLEMRDGQFL